VIGASTWLEDLDFGICKEILVSEAFRPVHDVERLTLGLLALTGVVTGLAIFTSFRNVRLQDAISDKRQIGSYILGDKIGEGGMGTIYECQHALLRRPTAMKLLDGHKADPDTLARFEREVQIASELTHPNTVQIYDFGRTEDDVFYIAMELLPGLDLNQLVKHSGAQSSPRVIHILRHAGQALLEAHRRGLIHRDIKPANIMLCERGGYFDFVKVLDYGLACSYVEDPNHELTRDGIVRGTPGYIAPERLSGKEDVRGDIFSLAAVAYYLLTGWPAFASPAADSWQSILQQQPPSPTALTSQDVPQPLIDLILSCLATAPVDRPADLTEVLDRLDPLAQSHPWPQSEAEQWWRDYAAQQRMAPRSPAAG
jgi:serine/threonine protein kinase